jgi:glycosyltransferase involved in cell wall biosynthesis
LGPREIIRHGIDGILVPPLDVEALAAAMARLLENRDEADRLGRAAEKVKERFAPDRIMRSWEELLTTVCATSKQ